MYVFNVNSVMSILACASHTHCANVFVYPNNITCGLRVSTSIINSNCPVMKSNVKCHMRKICRSQNDRKRYQCPINIYIKKNKSFPKFKNK